MKNYIVTLLLVLFIFPTVWAQPDLASVPSKSRRIDFAMRNMMLGLRTGNDGVIESVLMLTARLRTENPAVDISELHELIDSIAVSHSSPSVRYKAFIVSHIIEDPSWFMLSDFFSTGDANLFYRSASEQLQNKMIGMNIP